MGIHAKTCPAREAFYADSTISRQRMSELCDCELSELRRLEREREETSKQIEQLRKALEFYAHELNYLSSWNSRGTVVEEDKGALARRVLNSTWTKNTK